MTKLIRIGSKIFNPRHIIFCEPVKIWVETSESTFEDQYHQEIEALKISLVGRHELIISPEEWQGVKEQLDIVVVEAKPLPDNPAPALPDEDYLPF